MPCGALNRTARSATIASAHPSFAYVETDATLKALAEVAAGIAFETKIADTAVKGATFAAKHAEVVGQTLEALRKSGDQHPFARVRALPDGSERAKEEWMTLAAGRPAASQAGPEPARPPHLDGGEKQMIGRQ